MNEKSITVFVTWSTILISISQPLLSAVSFTSPGSLGPSFVHRKIYKKLPLWQTNLEADHSLVQLKMASVQSSTTEEKASCSTSEAGSENDSNDVLWNFATHTHESYHYFQPDEAEQIRDCLLKWYRSTRRKLPWRGDIGPFDGSTAGIASTKNTTKSMQKKQKKNVDNSQKSIKSFFINNSEVKKEKKLGVNNDDTLEKETMSQKRERVAIAITGYSVWVSEIMLQQTRVEAVIPYYLKWMKSFPTVQDLAKATEDEVNAHWAGLGFYRRARMLHKGAQYVTNDLNAIMPNTVDELMKIDGIGRYTASAVASIAFDTCVPVVDGNVCRVLSRLKGVANHIKAPIFKDGVGWKLAEQIVTAGDGLYAGEVNQAMMELGATYCAPSATGIDDNDPLKGFYLSTTLGTEVQKLMQTQLGSNQTLINEYVNNAFTVRGDVDKCALCNPDGISSVLLQISEEIGTNVKEYPAVIGHANFPTPPPKKTKREEVIVIAAMSIDYGEIDDSPHWLMVKRPKDGLLAGQWEFPSQCIWSSAEKISGSNKKLKKKGKIDVPSFDHKVRRNAIIELLHQYDFDNDVGDSINVSQLWSSNENSAIIVNEDSPIEHIFSHVRHSMWIEGINVPKQNVPLAFIIDQSFFLSDGREYKWMNDNTMNSVGITSAIKKILGAINKKRKNNPSSQTKMTKRKKRS